jgi:hypothetical protein
MLTDTGRLKQSARPADPGPSELEQQESRGMSFNWNDDSRSAQTGGHPMLKKREYCCEMFVEIALAAYRTGACA